MSMWWLVGLVVYALLVRCVCRLCGLNRVDEEG